VTQPLFIDVFIEPNPNTPEGCGLRFKSEAAPRAVHAVRYDGALYDVAGWSSAGGGTPCPALAATVEDSGAGTATLVYGGDWGLRLTPRDGGRPFGEAYLLLDASAVL
jgi:CubicO group peptidase (beta-lactamase class C family)